MADLTGTWQRKTRNDWIFGKTVHRFIVQLALIVSIVLGPAAGSVFAADEISRLVLSKNEVNISVGDTYTITATAIYVSGATADVTIKTDWSVDGASNVATAYAGAIVGKAEGTALVKATYMGKTEFVNVSVVKKVRSLSKNKQELSLRVGGEDQINLTATYTDGNVADVTTNAEWSTENDSVADVINGKVTAIAAGETNINATYGGKTVTIPVSVDKVRRLDPDPTSVDLRVGAQKTVKLMAMFENGITEDVFEKATWSSDNGSVADAFKGVITAYGSGQTTIRAQYGGKTAAITVSVETVRKLEADVTDVFLQPDASKQVKLTATYADGSTAEITDKADWESSDDAVAEVDKGLIIAGSVGQADVTATYGGKSVKISVDAGVARKLDASATDLMMRKNKSETITLTATYADGKTEDVTGKADWFSDDESVAYVSKGVVQAYGKGEATITATYGDKSVTIPVSVDTTQSLKADSAKLELKLQASHQLKLTVTYADGNAEDVTAQAEWSTDNDGVASVYKGLVTAIRSGQATITAQYGGKTVTIPTYVEIVKKLTVNKSDLFLKVNGTGELKLEATYADGAKADVTDLAEWSSDNGDVVGVDKGSVIAYKSGQASVTATYGSKTATVIVDVSVARKLTASPKSLSMRKGDTKTVKLDATYADGSSETVTDGAEWISNDQSIAVVTKGSVKAIGSGETTITVKYGDKSVTVPVEVDPAAKLTADQTKFDVSPGDTVHVKLTATYADETTEDVTDKAVWTTSNAAFATVSDGTIIAVDRGEATITAQYGKRTVKITVSVGALDTLTISDKTLVMKEDENKQLTVTAKYKDGTIKDVTRDADWTSSSASVATVSGGVVTAVASGKATITAKFGEKSVTASAQVELADKLTASHRSVIVRKGQTAQVTLTATYADGSTEDVTSKAVWSVTSSKIADVTGGLVTAYERGKTTLVAKYGSKTLNIPLEVDYAVKLTASKRDVQLKSGGTEQLTLTATFSDGSTRDVTGEAEWTARSYKVADIDAGGLVTAAGYGKTAVTAKFGGKSVSVAVEVDSLKYLKTSVKTIEMSVGEKKKIALAATYKDGTTGDVAELAEWKSSRENTADAMDGTITAYEKGAASVSAKFGGKTVSIRVIVK
ncbi:Ig-like domain-containing protein [Paenibacillus sp. GYB003]|uniref:Ig-like domain-containing protein n=1 Tax=Paenibacillus sp. GYB003 TaxID=2994392 RepID=UPI002F96235F